jgi:uncharacterized protein (TIGR02679 family)
MTELEDLHGEGWRRLLAAARRRLGKSGGELTGSLTLAGPSPAERRVIDKITDRYAKASPARLTVRVREVDTALRRAYGTGLLGALALLDRPEPIPDLRTALENALRCRHAGEGWFTGWLGAVTRDGTANRLVRDGHGDLLGWAAAVLDRLPGRDVPLPLLAEWATGDPAALSGTPLATLVLRALVFWQGAAPPVRRADEHRIWNDAGVLADDLADQVLVLNLRVREDHLVGGWLASAAAASAPFRITLAQLVNTALTPDAEQVFVCESPAVLRAAASGGPAGPLICFEGRISAACHRLLTATARERIAVHWHTGFDWPGLRVTAAATNRYAARPWRMSAADYLEALGGRPAEPLNGPRTATPWDPALADALAREGRAVREEWLLPALLSDLRARSAG